MSAAFTDAIWCDIVAVAACPKVAELGIGDGMMPRFIVHAPSAKVR
jgi:hypothetical protein